MLARGVVHVDGGVEVAGLGLALERDAEAVALVGGEDELIDLDRVVDRAVGEPAAFRPAGIGADRREPFVRDLVRADCVVAAVVDEQEILAGVLEVEARPSTAENRAN